MLKDDNASGQDARSFWVTGRGCGEIRFERVSGPRDGEVLVRTLFTGISRGTESVVFNGRVPASEFDRMRAPFQAGQFPSPVKYGYSNVGVVEDGPQPLKGRRVFCLYPHQTRYVVPADAVYPLPDNVPSSRAVLAANLETAINGLWDASPRIGDSIAVVGAGTIGCMMAWLASRIAGCVVELIDINPDRTDVARQLGVSFASPENARPEADLVIHTSAAAEGLATAIRIAGCEATVLEMSWFGDRKIELSLGESFHSRRLTLKSSQVGTVALPQRSRWTFKRRMELALRLLNDPILDYLITGESRFDELPDLMRSLAIGPGTTLCHRIVYG